MGIYIVLLIVVGLCTLLFTNPYTGYLYRNNKTGVRIFFFIVFARLAPMSPSPQISIVTSFATSVFTINPSYIIIYKL